MEARTIRVRHFTGKNAVTPEAGQRVFRLIGDALCGDAAVVLDFEGVRVFSGTFFNYAVAQLYRDYPRATLQERVRIEGLPDYGRCTLNVCLSSARKTYGIADC